MRQLMPALLGLFALCATAQPVVEEVPFITTPDNVTLEMLRIAHVGPSDHVLDLGSGDGRIPITAAKQFGASGFGVEIDPALVVKSNQNAREAGVADRAKFVEQDLFKTDLSRATVITMYLLPEVNLQLRPKLLALKPGTRVVSHDWDMGDWKPDRTLVVPVPDKKIGLDKSSKVHLWTVPARVDGLWCGTNLLGDFSLRLQQKYQEVEGTLTRKQRVRPVHGKLDGNKLQTERVRNGSLLLEVDGERMKIIDGEGPLMLTRGGSFVKSLGSKCG
ncbi:MAG: class I SAM-dependent methyltransferase [Burkholderiales bacterium]|nr:class I SAM-dependent methyltransferase [Burkholderiales bacterium]